MKRIRYSSAAKKDLKRYRNDPRRMRRLYEVLQYLAAGEPVPAKYLPHKLSGDYAGCMECHVGGDFLLVWIDEDADTVVVVRVGSHSELF